MPATPGLGGEVTAVAALAVEEDAPAAVRALAEVGVVHVFSVDAAKCARRDPSRSIVLGAGQRFRVLDVVPFEDEDESPFVGLLQVEAA